MLFIKCCRGTESCHPSVSHQQWHWTRQLECTRMHWHRPCKLADSEAWIWQWFLKLMYLLFSGNGYHFETHSKSLQFQDIEETNNVTSILVWFLSRTPFTLSTNLIKCHFSPCHSNIFSHSLFLFLKIESSPKFFSILNTTCSSFYSTSNTGSLLLIVPLDYHPKLEYVSVFIQVYYVDKVTMPWASIKSMQFWSKAQ